MQHLRFIQAKNCDIDAIVNIHHAHVLDRSALHSHGFLLTRTNKAEIDQHLQQSVQYFVAINYDAQVAGFLALSPPKINNRLYRKLFCSAALPRYKTIFDKVY